MNKLIYIIVCLSIVVFGCKGQKQHNNEFYGNSFIHIDNSDFKAPQNWLSYCLFDSSFQIKLPPYMVQRHYVPIGDSNSSVIFMYSDSTNTDEYHYGRVGIDYYYRGNGDFNKVTDHLTNTDREAILSPIVNRALKGGVLGEHKFPDGEILNGPFYKTHILYDRTLFFAYDAFYRRNGAYKNDGAVSCHIFLLMNKYEAVVMTVSHFDKDSTLFDNLFNVVKTFKWTIIHN